MGVIAFVALVVALLAVTTCLNLWAARRYGRPRKVADGTELKGGLGIDAGVVRSPYGGRLLVSESDLAFGRGGTQLSVARDSPHRLVIKPSRLRGGTLTTSIDGHEITFLYADIPVLRDVLATNGWSLHREAYVDGRARRRGHAVVTSGGEVVWTIEEMPLPTVNRVGSSCCPR